MPRAGHDPEQTEAEIRSEQMQLRKADAGISNGRTRLRKQECLIASLAEPRATLVSRRTKEEAERLAVLMRDSLAEWERHRALIEQRLAYLRVRHERELKS